MREVVNRIGSALGLKSLKDWYSVRVHEFVLQRDGRRLLAENNNSLAQVLKRAYPEFNWTISRINSNPPIHREILLEVGRKLHIEKFDDWYRIVPDQINRNGGTSTLRYYGNSMQKALLSVFPEHDWKLWRFHQRVPIGFWLNEENQRCY